MKPLFSLLPAVHRLRDAAQGDPLRALLNVMDREVQLVEDDISRLYDNWFIETCDEWVVPYIADLLGVRALPGVVRGCRVRFQPAKLRRQHPGLPPAQGHGGRARTARARHHRLAMQGRGVLRANGTHAARQSSPSVTSVHGRRSNAIDRSACTTRRSSRPRTSPKSATSTTHVADTTCRTSACSCGASRATCCGTSRRDRSTPSATRSIRWAVTSCCSTCRRPSSR